MAHQRRITTISVSIIASLVMIFEIAPQADAMDQISADNIQAAMRTLTFLESLPQEGPIVVGVVFPSDVPASQAAAEATAQLIATVHGPNSRTLKPLLISDDALAQFDGHLDVLFLVTGISRHCASIVDVMRRRHLVSISDDPSCSDLGCGVVTVRTGQRVEISLNTALADAVGARFSLIFTMVVKRK
ncbi:MAG TPA: hypothetical protein VGF96_01975 [Terracidiphilus sp.]|jgi:hypothetical protein